MIEFQSKGVVVRHDIYMSSPDTTNNRMALNGAIAAVALLSRKRKRRRIAYISDSRYLIDGMTEWVHSWAARGWKRKGGPIENLGLWQTLHGLAKRHDIEWIWVRGHAGNPKNEYVNDLAVRAAGEQINSDGPVPSALLEWMKDHPDRLNPPDYDPDEAFFEIANRVNGK